MAGIIATKLEMTRIIKDDKFIPVTLLRVPKLRVVWKKTTETDCYEAIIVWVLGDKTDAKLGKDKKTLNKNDFSVIKEFPLNDGESENFNVGDTISLDNLEWVESVKIESISKWKWFTWAMKRHNFHGWPKTHGSKFHRALGSIGNRKPKRTHKWKKMHGHHWSLKISLRKVPLEFVNKQMSIIWVRWGVPGSRNSKVNIIF